MKFPVLRRRPSPKSKSVKSKSAGPRIRATPQHRTLRLSKKRYSQPQPIPSAFWLFKATFSLLINNKKVFIGITLLNAVISFIFIQGLGSSFDIVGIKQNLNELVDTRGNEFGTAIALFGYLIGSAGSSVNDTASIYQLLWALITSLALIWVIRQIQAGEKPRLKDSYYKGMYPLVPFVLVLMVIAIQLVPLLLGNLIYSTILENGLAITVLEQAIWLLLFILLALLSGYMMLSSLFGLYIVTLPDMTPLRALRSARELVLHRRWAVALRLLALPAAMLLLSALIFIPLIIIATPVVEITFLLLTSVSLAIVHAYMYLLYRSLI